MENFWIASGDVQAGWSAMLGEPDDGLRLARWMHRLISAGTEHEVYRVLGLSAAGYAAADGPSLAGWLDDRRTADGVLDIGHFGSADPRRPPRISGRLAWVDASGAVVEGDVENLGALLRSLPPEGARADGSHMLDGPPVEVDGPLVDLRQPGRTRWWRRRGRVVVDISVRSDIWSPWVAGVLAPSLGRPAGFRDNRPLAERHTPRLNAFLADVRQATEEAGGEWELDEEAPLAKLGLVTADGFDLGAPNPWAG